MLHLHHHPLKIIPSRLQFCFCAVLLPSIHLISSLRLFICAELIVYLLYRLRLTSFVVLSFSRLFLTSSELFGVFSCSTLVLHVSCDRVDVMYSAHHSNRPTVTAIRRNKSYKNHHHNHHYHHHRKPGDKNPIKNIKKNENIRQVATIATSASFRSSTATGIFATS